jgi:hypothetical protein
MDMKKLLTIVSGQEKKQINESVAEAGCGMQQEMQTTPPVSMNVSMNAQGIDQIKELLKLVGNDEKPMAIPTAITPMPAVKDKQPAMTDLIKIAGGETEKEEFANEPDVQVRGLDAAIPSGDDLHRTKKSYSDKPFRGDNPMAAESIRAQLDRLYMEIKEGKKAKPDFLDIDKDGDKKEPMKKAAADKKKNPFAKKESVEEAAFEKSGVRAGDKKKGKVDKSERKQYFVKLEKDGKTKGMTIVADEGESQSEVRDRAARDAKSGGWSVASIRVKEQE